MRKGVVVLCCSAMFLSSCGPAVISAIESSELFTQVNMSTSINVDPIALSKAKALYVVFRNFSDEQSVDITKDLKENLKNMGYNLTDDPQSADFVIAISLRKVVWNKETAARDVSSWGAAAGAYLGARTGDDLASAIGGGLLGMAIGSLAGAIAGSAIKIESALGIVDIEIDQRIEPQRRYTAQMDIFAKETNMDKAKAFEVISQKLSQQLGQVFRK